MEHCLTCADYAAELLHEIPVLIGCCTHGFCDINEVVERKVEEWNQ